MSLSGRKQSKRYGGSLSPVIVGVALVTVVLLAAWRLKSGHNGKPDEASNGALSPSIHNSWSDRDGLSEPRKVFPLSVIRGGVYSQEELARARRSDAVVAAHYADFGAAPHFQKLAQDTLLYVSYRKKDQVFWSKSKHVVRQGETVISDGNCMARARCGNRLSASPQRPVEPGEPEEEALNTPEIPDEPISYKLADLPGTGFRTFEFDFPSSFAAESPGSSTAPGGSSGGTAISSGPATYFASGPGGAGGGSGFAAAAAKPSPNKPSTTGAAPGDSLLPVTTTGGGSLPSSSTYPITPPPSSGGPVGIAAELVPEPSAGRYFGLLGSLGGLSLLLRSLGSRLLRS